MGAQEKKPEFSSLAPKGQMSKRNKTRIFETSLVLSIVFAMVALYFIGRARNMEQSSFKTSADLELKGKVFVSSFENGALRLNLTGKNLLYNQRDDQAVLSEPVLEIWDQKGMTQVQGKNGIYDNQRGVVHLRDGVEILYQDYRAETLSLDYNVKDEIAESDQEIRIKGKELDLKGKGYKFDLKKGEMELKSEVKGKIKKLEKTEEKKEETKG